MSLPLQGVRVVELTTAWAGPFVGRFMGALGADVIKVESARALDLWRGAPRVPAAQYALLPGPDTQARPYDRMPNFNGLNRNKRGICIDVASAEGRRLLLQLVAASDLLLSNLTARVLPNLRLDYAHLRAVRPDIVLLAMPALGVAGPYSGAAGYGSIIEGLGGLGARFGYREEGARISLTYYPDAVAGIHATVAALAVLRHRRDSGEGAFIDLSQQEALWLQLGEGIVERSQSGRTAGRLGNAEPGCSPSGIYPAAGGAWLALVVRTDDEFGALVACARPAFDALAALDRPARLARRDELDRALAAWTQGLSLDAALEALRRAGLRAGPYRSYRDAAGSAEFNELSVVEEVAHLLVGLQRYPRVPLRYDGESVTSRRAAPAFAADTDAVLAELLGLSSAGLAALRERGVIADAPEGA